MPFSARYPMFSADIRELLRVPSIGRAFVRRRQTRNKREATLHRHRVCAPQKKKAVNSGRNTRHRVDARRRGSEPEARGAPRAPYRGRAWAGPSAHSIRERPSFWWRVEDRLREKACVRVGLGRGFQKTRARAHKGETGRQTHTHTRRRGGCGINRRTPHTHTHPHTETYLLPTYPPPVHATQQTQLNAVPTPTVA